MRLIQVDVVEKHAH